ncbi:hypothetical protein HYPSUDRAFT_685147 [Hypholoma sublateritium FD-334 SS-4]|uniref:DUF6534 domain-containing protein n=1 Tax=Hypholoma sublateritium (strain FD-334 SS-4) TaxID=945553 RepID=A0A0D2L4A7_HYPSF|nr:hypothetical protein HYPSUDRAFT_685147 [Hypholoma sublateritium FD-334 SS-4]
MTSPYVLFTGPIFIGSFLNWGFFGILILQVYHYFESFPEDRLGVKVFVYTLLALDTIQSVFATAFAWNILVDGWGNPVVFAQFTWAGVTIPLMTGLVSAIVQIFFAWRIWILKPNSMLAHCMSFLIVVVALLQCSSAFAGAVKFALASNDIKQFLTLTPVVKIWLAGSFVCDILIAGSMIWILTEARSSSEFQPTDSLITKLIINTVETGAVTAATALVQLILFLTMGNSNFVFEVPALLLGKLYSNVVLATLNGRLRNREIVQNSQLRSVGPMTTVDRSDQTIVQVSTDITSDGKGIA